MLGGILHSTFTQTRKANGELIRNKCKNTIGPWKGGKFMPLTDRPWSLNCYALSKCWFICHCMQLRESDKNFIQSQVNSFLFADQLEKPQGLIKFRTHKEGGLGLVHIASKALGLFIRSFLETSINPKFIRNVYHEGIYMWNIEGRRDIPEPPKNPFFTENMFDVIRDAMREDRQIVKMTSKDWNNFLLEKTLNETVVDEFGMDKTCYSLQN